MEDVCSAPQNMKSKDWLVAAAVPAGAGCFSFSFSFFLPNILLLSLSSHLVQVLVVSVQGLSRRFLPFPQGHKRKGDRLLDKSSATRKLAKPNQIKSTKCI